MFADVSGRFQRTRIQIQEPGKTLMSQSLTNTRQPECVLRKCVRVITGTHPVFLCVSFLLLFCVLVPTHTHPGHL